MEGGHPVPAPDRAGRWLVRRRVQGAGPARRRPPGGAQACARRTPHAGGGQARAARGGGAESPASPGHHQDITPI